MQRPSSIACVVIFFKAVMFNWYAKKKPPLYQEYESMATILLAHGMPKRAKNLAERGEMIRRAWRERNHDPLYEALFAILIAKADAQIGQLESAHSHTIRPTSLLEWFRKQAGETTDNSAKCEMYVKIKRVARGLYELYVILGEEENADYFMSITYEAETLIKLKQEGDV